MAAIKSYTDLEQSKTLNKILPIESADYFHAPDVNIVVTEPYITDCGGERCIPAYHGAVPCWSLSALLSILPDSIYDNTDEFSQLEFTKKSVAYIQGTTDGVKVGALKDNLVDACVEMIIKLHEQNIL